MKKLSAEFFLGLDDDEITVDIGLDDVWPDKDKVIDKVNTALETLMPVLLKRMERDKNAARIGLPPQTSTT